jgi:hypothetical protein
MPFLSGVQKEFETPSSLPVGIQSLQREPLQLGQIVLEGKIQKLQTAPHIDPFDTGTNNIASLIIYTHIPGRFN